MASPHAPIPVATPPLHSPTQSQTPPPRPPSAPSVYAPRPVRVPAYRPAFSRPMFISEGPPNVSSQTQTGRTSSPLNTGIGARRSSSASISSITGAITNTTTDSKEENPVPRPPSGVGEGGDSRISIYSPATAKDALEELFKIMRRSASSTSPPVGAVSVKGFVGLPTRSPNFRGYGHRRDASDASDSSLSGAMSGLLLGSRLSPDADLRPSLSPVARTLVRNPMVRDPSFNREPSPNPNAPLQPTAINPIVTVNLEGVDDAAAAEADNASSNNSTAAVMGEIFPPTPVESNSPSSESQQQAPSQPSEAPDVKSE